VRSSLVARVAESDRLVLLGDTLELRHGPIREALAAAEPVFGELAGALVQGAEIVVVPGNHDHGLLRGWLARRAAESAPPPLGLQAAVDWRPDEPLDTLERWLAPTALRVAYPGIWLRPDVYATHGHYSDRHTTVPILERLGAALMTRVAAEPAGGPVRAEDYETVLAPIYAWIESVAQNGGVRGRGGGGLQVRAWQSLQRSSGRRAIWNAATAAALRALVAGGNRAGLGPFGADVSGAELRRAALRAFDQVLVRLGVGGAHAIFGHTHRAGPLPGDNPFEWRSTTGAAMLNTGSWVYEPGFLGDAPGESPYRPGFCALVEADGAPQLVNLLDPA
jgi:hypothetical protein